MTGYGRLLATAAIVAATGMLAGCLSVPAGVTPVTGFDAERYQGLWYEVARLDHRFERGLTNVTAEYSLRADGTLSVVNRGFDPATCAFDVREGSAEFVGSPDVASLAVTFFEPFAGGYHIVYLGARYDTAVVVGPTRDYLWVLSRRPDLPDATIARLTAGVAAAGFPVDELILVDHDPPRC